MQNWYYKIWTDAIVSQKAQRIALFAISPGVPNGTQLLLFLCFYRPNVPKGTKLLRAPIGAPRG